MEDLREADYPGLHRYCDTAGIAPLVDAIVAEASREERPRLRARRGCS